jgi:hypothetical protein
MEMGYHGFIWFKVVPSSDVCWSVTNIFCSLMYLIKTKVQLEL